MAQFKKNFPNSYSQARNSNVYNKITSQPQPQANRPVPKAHIVNKLADALASIPDLTQGGYRVFTAVPAEAVGTQPSLFDPQNFEQCKGHVCDLVICRSGHTMPDILCMVQLEDPADISFFPHSCFPKLWQICTPDSEMARDPSAITSFSKEMASHILQERPNELYSLGLKNVSQLLQTSHDAALGRMRAAGLCATNKAGKLVVTKRGTSVGLIAEHTPKGSIVYLNDIFEEDFMKALGFTKE